MFPRVVDFESMTNNQTRVQLVIIRLILQLERCSWYHLKAYFMPIPRMTTDWSSEVMSAS